jgi:hypothetical protein
MYKGPHPRILENIFSVIRVAGNSQNNSKYLFAMTPAKFGTHQLLAVRRRYNQLHLADDRQRGSELTQSMLSCDLSMQTVPPHPRLISCRPNQCNSLADHTIDGYFPQTGRAEWMKFQERSSGADALANCQLVGARPNVLEFLQEWSAVAERSLAFPYQIEGCSLFPEQLRTIRSHKDPMGLFQDRHPVR